MWQPSEREKVRQWTRRMKVNVHTDVGLHKKQSLVVLKEIKPISF